MIGWIAVAAAVVLGVVLLGFCLYEVTWKTQRLRRDLRSLTDVARRLAQAQAELTALRNRMASSSSVDR